MKRFSIQRYPFNTFRASSLQHLGLPRATCPERNRRKSRGFTPVPEPRSRTSSLRGKLRTVRGFTLLELLIVVALLAVIAVALIFILNPAETLRKARDSRRLSDIATLKSAIEITFTSQAQAGATDPDGPYTNSCLGESAQKVFISVPNTETPPILPPTWNGQPMSWQQVAPANLGRVDGFGWMPVDLTTTHGGSSLGNIPIDPTNTFASGFYYTYTCSRNPHIALTAKLEAKANQHDQPGSRMAQDGGITNDLYEVGTNLKLTPDFVDRSLVGYWKMDETSWTNNCSALTAQDSSQYNNDGKSCPATTGPTGGASGKLNNAGAFDGVNDYVDVGNATSLDITNAITLEAWIKTSTLDKRVIAKGYDGSVVPYHLRVGETDKFEFVYMDGGWHIFGSSGTVIDGAWHHIVATQNSSGNVVLYKDGLQNGTYSGGIAIPTNNKAVVIGAYDVAGTWIDFFNGTIDEVRIFNRALSEAEIRAHYNALQ